MTNSTPFLARRWTGPAYGLTAILPTIPGNGPAECAVYDIPGQHGSALPFLALACTEPATPEETEELRKELQEIGYPNPVPRARMSQALHRTRRLAWRALLDALTEEVSIPLVNPDSRGTSPSVPANGREIVHQGQG